MKFLLLAVCLVALFTASLCVDEEEVRGENLMKELENRIKVRKNLEVEAAWKYGSNLTEHNLKEKVKISAENAQFFKEVAIELQTVNYQKFSNEFLRRQFEKLSKLGYRALPDDKFKELLNAIARMESNYGKVKICSYQDKTKCDLQLEPELTEVLINSRDPEELKYYWIEWYNKAGTPAKNDFLQYVQYNGISARLNNFTSGAEAWLDHYEDPTFEKQLEDVVEQLRPFYEQLHAYVRFKLHEKYGDVVSPTGSIPMHLLGNMWGQNWNHIADFTIPFPDKPLLDVTPEMIKQGYTPLRMFQMGDQFFQSLNMTKLPQTFWDKSILEKPSDGRELICHASAWDFNIIDDVRIKQCTRVTMDQFFVAHHELGHIQYYLQYQHLPTVYKRSANPGFHEAIGDVLSLSVSTPKHLEKVGLLKDFVLDEENLINQLYSSALFKIAFIPFAFVMDKYRWNVFRGDIKNENVNCDFWKLREKYGGIVPPVARSEADFDPPAKYHISSDVEYMRYLVSFIVQFQFHKGACIKAGQYDTENPANTPLSNCDIYESIEAGNALKAMLSVGSSIKWPEAMELLAGERKIDASAILEYYKPLQDWLEKTNKEKGVHVGWENKFECGADAGN